MIYSVVLGGVRLFDWQQDNVNVAFHAFFYGYCRCHKILWAECI